MFKLPPIIFYCFCLLIIFSVRCSEPLNVVPADLADRNEVGLDKDLLNIEPSQAVEETRGVGNKICLSLGLINERLKLLLERQSSSSVVVVTTTDSCCSLLESQLNIIESVIAEISLSLDTELIISAIEACCAASEIVVLESLVAGISTDIEILISDIEVIASGIEELESCCDIVNSKIGDLDDPGTCLDTFIEVPEDINDLMLSVIALLKTILLELRGCSAS